ncbi:Tfp pilus assembly protein FimT/FimU [Candidatus Margulisiibacteriota bacterium]
MRFNKGFTLIELIITISVIAILNISLLLYLPKLLGKLRLKYTLNEIYQNFNYSRNLAMAIDEDIIITSEEDKLILSTAEKKVKEFAFPSYVNLSMNVSKLGFKSSGYTKHAGTLTAQVAKEEAKIKLGVGYGIFSKTD